MNTVLFWLRRAGIVITLLAAGAIIGYAIDLVLSLFVFNTQVIIGVVGSLLTVGLVVWWAASALSDAVEALCEAHDEIDNVRAETSELLSYARELLETARSEIAEVPAAEMQAVRADTAEAQALITPQAVTAELDSSVEEWARAQVEKLWADRSSAEPIVELAQEPAKRAPAPQTRSTAARKAAPKKAAPARKADD